MLKVNSFCHEAIRGKNYYRSTLALFQVDAGRPPAILALVDRAFAVSALFLLCHVKSLLLNLTGVLSANGCSLPSLVLVGYLNTSS